MVFKLGSKKKKPSDAPATSSNGSSVAAAAVEEEVSQALVLPGRHADRGLQAGLA